MERARRMREVQEVMRMESELRSLIHLMVARHATDAHLTLRFGRLTLRLRCPERMIDDDSGMFDGRQSETAAGGPDTAW